MLKIDGLEVIIQFCIDVQKSRAWYTDFLGIAPIAYGAGLFVLGDNTRLHLAPAAPGTGRGERLCTFTSRASTRRTPSSPGAGTRSTRSPTTTRSGGS